MSIYKEAVVTLLFALLCVHTTLISDCGSLIYWDKLISCRRMHTCRKKPLFQHDNLRLF